MVSISGVSDSNKGTYGCEATSADGSQSDAAAVELCVV